MLFFNVVLGEYSYVLKVLNGFDCDVKIMFFVGDIWEVMVGLDGILWLFV